MDSTNSFSTTQGCYLLKWCSGNKPWTNRKRVLQEQFFMFQAKMLAMYPTRGIARFSWRQLPTCISDHLNSILRMTGPCIVLFVEAVTHFYQIASCTSMMHIQLVVDRNQTFVDSHAPDETTADHPFVWSSIMVHPPGKQLKPLCSRCLNDGKGTRRNAIVVPQAAMVSMDE